MGKQLHSFGESLRSWPSATGMALIRPSELADKVSRWSFPIFGNSETLGRNMTIHGELISALRASSPPAGQTIQSDLWEFVYRFGNGFDALLYAQLFCPELIDVEDSVIIQVVGRSPKLDFSVAKKRWAGTLSELESSFNVVEVEHLFSDMSHTDDAQSALLAKFIAEAWRARLLMMYPKRAFEVVILLPEVTGSGHEVRFSEIR
jgi:hypothetical protein